MADSPKSVNVPAGDLTAALELLEKQSGVEIIYRPELLQGLHTEGVRGRLSSEEAVTRLLQGTKLKIRTDRAGVLLITDAATEGEAATPDKGAPAKSNGRAPSGDRLHLGQAVNGQDQSPVSVDQSRGQVAMGDAPSGKVQLEEIVVTAQKREERLQDVPVPVTAISADTLLESNEVRLQDYYNRVPGLNITTDDFGTPLITIRGLTTGAYTNPTVGFVVDDVPYGASSATANGQQVPDIDPNDLARIEVLRGPQGTLYGASSLGGLVKFVTVSPSSDAFSGRMQGSTEAVRNGAQLGYNVRGSVNVPISDSIALRASGFTRQDPGYIDNIQTGEQGANSAEVYGVRLAALWRVSDALAVKLSALSQDGKLNGSAYVDRNVNGFVGPNLNELKQFDLRDTGWLRQNLRAFSVNVNAKLGAVDLTSVTGYNTNTISDSFDATPFYSSFAQQTFGVSGTPLVTYNKTYKFTEELRLSGSIRGQIEWLAGGFYNHEESPGSQDTLATDPMTGSLAGVGVHYANPSTFKEYAGFADLTFHLGNQFDVQLGGRQSENRQSLTDTRTGPFFPAFEYPRADSRDHSFTYLVTPRLRLSSDLMVYARLASGYRPGGPNAGVSGNIPTSFRPDKTQNYEIGTKGDVLSHLLSFDVSLYRIDWKDVQLFLVDPTTGIGYGANGSRAKSQGVEFSVESTPISGTRIGAWVAWNDAKLTEPLPPTASVQGAAGDRLPYTSRFSGSLSLDEQFPVAAQWDGIAGAVVSYIGARQGIFVPAPPRQEFPGYAKTDLHFGVKHQHWTATVYVNNVADKRGLLNGGVGTFLPWTFQYIQPRTAGISLVDAF